MIYGNATYVFRDNWVVLSRLSKAEIVKKNIQEKRLAQKKMVISDCKNVEIKF